MDKVQPSNLTKVSRHSPPCGEGLISWSQTLTAGNTSLARGQCVIGVCVSVATPQSNRSVFITTHPFGNKGWLRLSSRSRRISQRSGGWEGQKKKQTEAGQMGAGGGGGAFAKRQR